VESCCKLGNEPSGSIKCWELPSGCTTCDLSSGTQLHRVRSNQAQTRLHSNGYKPVAETVVTKELGEHVSAVMRLKLHFRQRLSDLFGVGQGTAQGRG
jgi:hypothetical protein